MNANERAVALTTALLLFSGRTMAQDVVSIPPGNDVIVPMKKGEPAPADGQFFDNATSLRWANWLMQYKQIVKTNKELDQSICNADVDLQKKKIELLQAQYDAVTKDLQQKLSDAQKELASPPWYKTPGFGIIVGVVGTVAVAGVTAALVNAAVK